MKWSKGPPSCPITHRSVLHNRSSLVIACTAGTAPQQTVYKNAVAGGLNGGILPHMLQPQRQATHSPDENRAPIFASNVSLTGPGARQPAAAVWLWDYSSCVSSHCAAAMSVSLVGLLYACSISEPLFSCCIHWCPSAGISVCRHHRHAARDAVP